MDAVKFQILPLTKEHQEWTKETTTVHWGDDYVVVHQDIYYPWRLPGFLALGEGGEKLGLITYSLDGSECEIITLNSFHENQGVGTALVKKLIVEAERKGCHRICVTTTNDNQRAIDFYLRKGFHLAAVHPGGAARSRLLKPAIPRVSPSGIPVEDEWEFELLLADRDHRKN